MAKHLLFTYEEFLPAKTLHNLPKSLSVSNSSSELFLLLRLLSGAIDLRRIHDNKKILQRKNYFVTDNKGYSKNWPSKFPLLFDASFTAKDLADVLNSIQCKQNRHFYKDILNEFSCYFGHLQNKSHTAGFIHVYRILEYISYAFPMIYASNAPNFKGTYNHLKEWFVDSKAGKSELKFFESFVKKILENDPIITTTVEFKIPVGNKDIQESLYKAVKKSVPKDGFSIADSVEFQTLAINFSHIGGFIINARNYFVHYLSRGDENYSASEIIDSDLFFSLINDKCLTWISMIFLEVVKFNFSRIRVS